MKIITVDQMLWCKRNTQKTLGCAVIENNQCWGGSQHKFTPLCVYSLLV